MRYTPEKSQSSQPPTSFIRLAVLVIFSVSLGYFFFPCQPSLAQDEEAPVAAALPPGVPVIPTSSERDNVLFLTGKNELSYEDVLIAPLAAWLKDGKFALRVVRNLDFAWRYSPSWEDNSRRNVLEFDLQEDHSLLLRNSDPPAPGFPFGNAEDINQESDPVRKAYKILWNISYSEGIAEDIYYQLELAWIGTQALLRGSSGGLYRRTHITSPLVPKKETEAAPAVDTPKTLFNATSDIFREEALRLFYPPVINGWTELTKRTRNAERDQLWLFSPVLKLLRPLMPANRTDAILGGNMSVDDMFVWANKVQSVDARVVDQKVVLVPFPAINYYRLDAGSFVEKTEANLLGLPLRTELPPAKEEKPKGESVYLVQGFHQRPDSTRAMVLWNHQSRQLPQLAPWVPTTTSFVPRRVWILELSPKDPYSNYGREILMVDQESMLPVYKLVYDRIGEYRKTVLGGWGLAKSKDGKTRVPFCAFVISVDQSNQSVNTLTTQSLQLFGQKEGRAAQLRSWLDLSKYPKPEQKKAAPEVAPEEEEETVPEPAPTSIDD